jgi:hypothetical protein
MKRLFFKMIIVSTVIISTLGSCSKDAPLADPNTNVTTQSLPIILNLTAYHWELASNGVFVSIFKNVIPVGNANHSVKIYLVTDGKDGQINQPISFMNGQLWATNTETDVVINYRGSSQHIPYLNIKVVLDR